ncbi:MAG: tRNA pseudouridine(38-40) synthase TruA [Chlamydiota bacterium]
MNYFRYKLILSYDGTHYGGWQIQPNSLTIQELVQKALTTALRHETHITGSGRTDAGVHARAQVAHFTTDTSFDIKTLLRSLNGLLPPDIRIFDLEPVSDDFHARYSAQGKIYHYHLHLERYHDPFNRLYSTHIRYPLDQELLKKAALLFLGTHDFTSFANEAHRGAAANNPIKTLKRLDIIQEPGGIRLEFEGNGFLYKMVRNIVGTLLEIASKQRKIEEIPELFAAKNRCLADTAAPPQGLFLHQVLYTQRR